jgi:filamentous hemagglutinin family protein
LNHRITVRKTSLGQSKGSNSKLITTALLLSASIAQAAPVGEQIVSGAGSVSRSDTATTITQSSQALLLNWKSFNIAAKETVNFVQPSVTAIAVNRIFDTNGTQILGRLNANGQVYLINPNGILFGPGAQVNVGGLVASTLNLNDASLNGVTRSFSGDGSGSIVNQGTITAAGGYVALLGTHVSNQGAIIAPLGAVALGAGSTVTLTFSGNSLVRMEINQSLLNSFIENGGLIRADGGMVVMNAGARDALLASVVNNTGVIEARTVTNHNGVITLLAGMAAGTVNAGGTLDASAPNGGNGGFIETSAAHVKVADDTIVTTAAAAGRYGVWLIDPQDYTVASSGGDITGAALSANLGITSITLRSSGGSAVGSGNVNVNDAVAWNASTTLTLTASNNVNINANITATGNNAGLAINPNTGNDGETASGTGVFNLHNASVTLSGANPSLAIAGIAYTVINSLGAAQDAATAPAAPTLQGMAASANLAGYYALGSNIDAAATFASTGAGFTPIGTLGALFNGTFEGLGHTISNLIVNLPAATNIGLFGATGASSVIRNVGLIGGSVSGTSSLGGLAGSNTGTISNSYTTGSVSGTSSLGGLTGSNTGTVSYSYAAGNVSGTSSLGGLMGSNTGTVSYSYAAGNVSGTSSLGGLMGSNTGPVSNSYATGSVTGTTTVGGLMGSNTGGVSNSYSTGHVIGDAPVGALMGSNTGLVTNTFWNTATAGQALSAGGAGLTNAEMLQAGNFSTWDFANTWIIYSGFTNPLLRSFMTPITVTANNAVKTYDRQAYSGGNGVSYSRTPNGNILGTVSYSGTSQGAINVGGYVITPGALYSNQQGYIISYGSGALTVNPAPLAVTGVTASDKVYNASIAATLGGTAAIAALANDIVSLSGTGSGVFADKNVGASKAVTVSGYSLSGADAANYVVVQPSNVTATITAASLGVTGVTAGNKVYNASTAATLGGTAAIAAFTNDTVSLSGTGSGVFADKNVGSNKAVTVTGYSLSGTDAGNYALTQPANITATITAAALAVTGVTASNKVYNASTAATLGGTATITALTNDTVNLTGTGSGVFADKNVGTNKVVTVSGFALSGADANNYALTQPANVTATITVAPLAVTGVTANDKVYNTSTVATLGGTAAITAWANDIISLSGTGSGVFADKNVSINKAVTVSGFTLRGADANNYALTQPANVTATITAASLAVTGVTASDKVYNNSTAATLGGTAAVAALSNDTVSLSGTGSGVFADKNVGTNKAVTVTGYTLSGADAGNYDLTQPANVTATITAIATIAAIAAPAGPVIGPTSGRWQGVVNRFITSNTPAIAMTPHSNADSIATGRESSSESGKESTVNTKMNTAGMGPALQIVTDGVLLPDQMKNTNE